MTHLDQFIFLFLPQIYLIKRKMIFILSGEPSLAAGISKKKRYGWEQRRGRKFTIESRFTHLVDFRDFCRTVQADRLWRCNWNGRGSSLYLVDGGGTGFLY